ncbi:palmitoyl-acyl carrier protein thioesterase, chloroplastic-like isoform X2 [Morus notabilis]|uniref:palmitoyl-acyl carrier protein thioesterase, chloroplastic-like isoform X2 n=1 Tax=Morus notabilis TaxID=981085 RepID=UPI000CECF9BA|nr:palmitoyl-acyl carrier protein thioesterase, chloroplastic-like isoform X2 [Morus notabilis]
MALHLAAPRSSILNKQEMCISQRISNSTTGNMKPNLNNHTGRLKIKLANVAAENLIKLNKAMNKLELFCWKQAGKVDENTVNHVDIFSGRLFKGGRVFQQHFLIRSYELGPDSKISVGALVNLLQESALNHFKSVVLVAEGFGSTPEMSKRNLIWVVLSMQIVIDSYSSWGDIVQVETWSCASGRHGARRDWLVRDYNTGKTLLRAVCVYVMLNKKTRKLSKFIQETREETKGMFMDHCDPIIEQDCRKLRDLDFDTADYIRTGLLSNWTDLDVNQHVNHVKYIDWILENAPESVVETHKLSAMRLEFRKECGKNSSLQSLCALARETHETETDDDREIEMDHTLRLVENGSQILRARTVWMPRN